MADVPGEVWLNGVKRVRSPNCDERPHASDISLLVIHNISLPPGEYGTGCVDALFTNRLDTGQHPALNDLRGLRVSSHLLIDRKGDVTQYVPLNTRAWHAGESSYQGCASCNDFAIGIELEGIDSEPYETPQYRRLTAITLLMLRKFPRLCMQSIVGHCEIAPDRKTDPGPAFEWQRFLADVQAEFL